MPRSLAILITLSLGSAQPTVAQTQKPAAPAPAPEGSCNSCHTCGAPTLENPCLRDVHGQHAGAPGRRDLHTVDADTTGADDDDLIIGADGGPFHRLQLPRGRLACGQAHGRDP